MHDKSFSVTQLNMFPTYAFLTFWFFSPGHWIKSLKVIYFLIASNCPNLHRKHFWNESSIRLSVIYTDSFFFVSEATLFIWSFSLTVYLGSWCGIEVTSCLSIMYCSWLKLYRLANGPWEVAKTFSWKMHQFVATSSRSSACELDFLDSFPYVLVDHGRPVSKSGKINWDKSREKIFHSTSFSHCFV